MTMLSHAIMTFGGDWLHFLHRIPLINLWLNVQVRICGNRRFKQISSPLERFIRIDVIVIILSLLLPENERWVLMIYYGRLPLRLLRPVIP